MYDGDAWQGVPPTCAPKHGDTHGGVEMLWIDFGVGDRLDEFLETYWPSVAPGGLVVVHSTVCPFYTSPNLHDGLHLRNASPA